jgi:hypothetical protein
MNLNLSQKDVTIITEALISRIDSYQVEGINDQVEASREAVEELVGKIQIAEKGQRPQ